MQTHSVDISLLDQVVVVVYFLIVFGFGSYFGKYIKSTKDFFFSGRKLAWWIVAVSMIATIVGSYSFIKYSAAGYRYGLSSSMSYLNDWYFMPLWMFAWLPIIYYSRVTSIPEYFERRFNSSVRLVTLLFITIYLIGYIGINFYTLGVALKALLGWDVLVAATVVAIITAIYVTSGGQTAVIMTDLFQGFILLGAGLLIFFLGLDYLGGGSIVEGLKNFWNGLPTEKKFALANFNSPPNFSFIGVFWQDAFAASFAAYFFNQGILMRFLSLKSVHEGRKAMLIALFLFFPLAVLAVGNAGWLGAAMKELGKFPPGYPQNPDPNSIFVIVTHILCRPGIFGFVMAALLAALMSTADTLINASSAIFVNDIWRPYIVKDRPDEYYLKVARWSSIAAAFLGLMLVPLFMSFRSIYVAHATFVATVTPPLAVSILMGFLWPRYTSRAALWTLIGGAVAIAVSIAFPQLVQPFAHGVDPSGNFKYMRALYGLVVSGVIGVIATFLTAPDRSEEELTGLTIQTIRKAETKFKGGLPANWKEGKKLLLSLRVEDAEPQFSAGEEPRLKVELHPDDLKELSAEIGDLIYISDRRWWLGGLRSVHAVVVGDKADRGTISLPKEIAAGNGFISNDGSEIKVRVEKIM